MFEFKISFEGYTEIYTATSEADAIAQWEAENGGEGFRYVGGPHITMVGTCGPMEIADEFSDDEIDTIIDYVEDEDGRRLVAREMSYLLMAHGYPCEYSDGALSSEARECAERLYNNYIAQAQRWYA